MYRIFFILVFIITVVQGGGGRRPVGNVGKLPKTVAPSVVVTGSIMETRKGRKFEAYRGIRYAEAPVGPLRFKPPKPIHNRSPVNASVEGPACPTYAAEYYYGNFSEDCLRLNVYTPLKKDRSEPLPVIVFIHPGGFYSMSGRSDLAGPHYLLDRDIVLITINYRLGSLGFLSTGDALAPGNNGMLDQVEALRWVQRNVQAFGGDPHSVTLAGCSAGAISVVLHTISPMSQYLFHRGISLSGSPTSKERTPTHLRSLANQQAQLLDCPARPTQQLLDCLRTKTWREIGDSLLGFFTFGWDPLGLWHPNVDQDFGPGFLPIDPVDAIKHKQFAPKPLIITQTRKEFAWKAFTILNNETLLSRMNAEWEDIAPLSFGLPQNNAKEAARRLREAYFDGEPLHNVSETAVALGELYGDALVGFPVHRLANLLSRHSSEPVYYGLFSYVGDHSHYEDPETMKPIGAMHHDDLIYLFSLSYRFPFITADDKNGPFVDFMTALWYQFAKYGDLMPRGDLPELTSLRWPAMTPHDRKYLDIDRKRTIRSNMFEERLNVWEELYPIDYE